MTAYKGSITIYMLLSLLLILALICTLTESGRISALNAGFREITYMAADSCFAGYAKEIFEDYGIMALWKNESEFTAEFNSYIRKNLDTDDLNLYRDADLFLMEHNASAITDCTWITDQNGRVFLDQVCEYMNDYLIRESAVALLSELDLFGSGSALAAFVRKINEYQDVFLKVGTIVSRIQSAADRAKGVVNNPRTLLGNMKRSMERYRETGQNVYVAQFNTYYWSLNDGKTQLQWYLDSIRTDTEEYYSAVEDAADAVEQLRTELDSEAEGLNEEAEAAIRLQLDTLALKTADPESDYYRVAENEELAQRYSARLASLDDLITDIGTGLTYENFTDYESRISEYRLSFDDFELNSLGLGNIQQRVKQEDSGFLSNIKDVFTKGLVAAIAGPGTSSRRIDPAQLPSAAARKGNGLSAGNGLLSAGYRRLQLSEYILRHFGNYREPKEETALQYETEYILGGKASDGENLKKVIEELIELREGLNLISFLKDGEKMKEAELLALGLVGFTGMESLVETVRLVIIAAWCLAESLCDAKTLLAGGKIPAVKEPLDWTVSSVGLKNFSKTVFPAASDEHGMDYEDYLRVMLLMADGTGQAYRTMDLIQVNACKNHNPQFRMKDCLTGIELQVNFRARQLFASFPFVRNLTGAGNGSYSFSYMQTYSY